MLGTHEAGQNIILATDSYKQSHWHMLPPNTRYLSSYFEARSGGEFPEIVFFGLQYVLDRFFEGERVTYADIAEAEYFCQQHFGQELFNREGWEHIVKAHGGRLPLSISAVPEGTVVPESNVLLTIMNTDPKCAWLVNHFETLLVELWYSTTVATSSRECKKVIKAALQKSGSIEKLPFMLHDFGYRGSTCVEAASIGGAAHLVNFMGTDTIAGIEMLAAHYQGGVSGFSVPAAEHSTITTWGRKGEMDAYRHILNRFNTGLVSVVSDSWDIYGACSRLWGDALKDEIVNTPGRTLVVRPDSGDPCAVVPMCLRLLGEAFGYTVNDKGYRVLPDYIRLIQGDGINRRSLPKILDAIMDVGWSLDNIVFGSGGGLLQDYNRDTSRFAMKCNWAEVDGEMRDVYKQPASDPTKNSKRGPIKLVKAVDERQNRVTGNIESWTHYETVPESDHRPNELVEVFRDGYIHRRMNLADIRQRAELR